MSNALVIAAVTAVLRNRLHQELTKAGLDRIGPFRVTASPPDRLMGAADPENRLNIYLWNVTPDPHRSGAGGAAGLAQDLHYILTATGAEDLAAEILLGHGMQVLHETPVLTPADIRLALGTAHTTPDPIPAPLRLLAAANMADGFEQIRITQTAAGSQDGGAITALWQAFAIPLRASALYQVSCVLADCALTDSRPSGGPAPAGG